MCVCEVCTLLLNPLLVYGYEIIWIWRESKIIARTMSTASANLFYSLNTNFDVLKMFYGKIFVIQLCDQCVSFNLSHSIRTFWYERWHLRARAIRWKFISTYIPCIDFECERQHGRWEWKVFIVKYSLLNVRAAIEKRIIIQNFLDEILFSPSLL